MSLYNPAGPSIWSDVASRQPKEVAEELLRLYDTGVPFFTKAVLTEITQQAEALNGSIGHIALKDLTGTLTSLVVGLIGSAEKTAIHDDLMWCAEKDTALRVIDEDMAKDVSDHVTLTSSSILSARGRLGRAWLLMPFALRFQGTKRSGVLRIDLDNLSQPALKELYSIVVEKLPSDREGVKRSPQLRFCTINYLYHKALFSAFDPQTAFLPVSLSSIKNFVPDPDAESGAALQKFSERLLKAHTVFEESSLFNTIKLDLTMRGHPRIRKIVGFACDEFEERHYAYTSMEQMGFLLALSRYLDRYRRIPQIACFVQDNRFSESVGWTEALAQLRVTVVNEPQAFLELDESTAVIAFNPTAPVRQITADLTRPAMMFWATGDNVLMPTKDFILGYAHGGYVYSIASSPAGRSALTVIP